MKSKAKKKPSGELHYSPRFLKEVWRPVQAAVEETGGEITTEIKVLFRDLCIAVGHAERIRNLYRIKDKLTSQAVFMVPNGPQEHYLKNRTGRDIILKTRQIGFTTLLAVDEYDRAVWEPNFAGGIMAHQQDAVKDIFDDTVKFTHYWFKKDWGQFYNPVEKSDNSTSLVFVHDGLGRELHSSLRVAFNFRSKKLSKLHVSEGAFIDPDRLLGSLQCVPSSGEVTFESTPNGLGGDFHRIWNDSKTNGKQAPYKPFFVPWYSFYPEQPEDPKWDLDEETVPLSSREREMIELYDLEKYHIAWRRWCISANCQGDEDAFEHEYPSNDIDCFLAGGEAQVFGASVLKQAQKTVRNPAKIGFLLLDGSRSILHPDEKLGVVYVWKEPEVGHEYCVGSDPASGIGKDRSVAYVFNRNTTEIVAKLEGHFDPGSFADELSKLGSYYHKAYICVEENNHGHTVIQRLKELRYSNMYKRRIIDEITNKPTNKLGFLTTNDSKLRITEQLKTCIKDGLVVIYDSGLIAELSTFMQFASKNGRTVKREAAPGSHDDRVMAAALTMEMVKSRGPLSIEKERETAFSREYDPETGYLIG